MEVEDLRTFVEVADAGGVSPAARRLNLAKSIVSRRLSRLEDELGVQLLARTTRGAALTEAGVTFRDHAARMFAELEAAREEILPAGELRGRLRLAAPSSFGPEYFAPALAQLAKRHPLLSVNVHFSDRYVDLVGEGYDCGIRVGYLPDSNLVARRIGTFAVSLFASPDYISEHGVPASPDEIADHPAVMIASEKWKFSRGGKTVEVHPHGRFKADSAVAIGEATAEGVGIAALPDVIAARFVEAGRLRAIMADWSLPSVGIFVVRPPGQHLARKVRVLTELLLQQFGGG
ncbi:LysR family transcriptional regulator [Sphingomonas sp. BK345]|uniref:LysR family transcriptional regulator n=1 Tax=Sphingomonas sp. BK345 TaxID=2586980 RepID=UPI00161759DC|nr:LysR family transcriptional regulator [Sphingomonas sp. BK345]MBB3473551.1 DNA-binding transcriptional LysR family regulator [Sphingomonas sp. BK345]